MVHTSLGRLIGGTLVLAAIISTRAPAGTPVDGYMTVDGGIRLHYRVLGSGPDTVVIPGDTWWAGHAEPLARGRRVILYDPRNRGRSDDVPSPSLLGMDHEIRDLESVRRHFALERMSLVGWSYLGAMVALYAAEHPDRVDAVVQVGPLSPRRDPYWDQYVKDQASRVDAAAERQLADMRQAGVPERDPLSYCRAYWPVIVRATLASAASASAAVPTAVCDSPNEWPPKINIGARKLIEGLGAWDWRQKVRLVGARVLLVHGARDNIPLDSSREWVRSFRNARLLVLDASGHFPFSEQPGDFVRAVDAFLQGDWPAGAVKVP